MDTKIIHLHKGNADDAWAINLVGDLSGVWRAEKGFGHSFYKVWSLEVQSPEAPDLLHVGWDAVLERAIYAYDLNDPVLSNFEWPLKHHASAGSCGD
jgi:hypothetical protein